MMVISYGFSSIDNLVSNALVHLVRNERCSFPTTLRGIDGTKVSSPLIFL